MSAIDWNMAWKDMMKNASMRERRGGMDEFWDRMAKRYNESVKHTDRVERIIPKLNIDFNCTVLDIGSGPGTFAVPLAKMVKQVTAVEPSAEMFSCLKRNVQEANIKNITCINKKWEDVVPFDDLVKHDVVMASHSLDMLNIAEMISKMNLLASRSVYLFTFAGKSISDYDKLWPLLYGQEYRKAPDYIYLYNILYDMGILANVEISISEFELCFSSLDEATEYWQVNLNERSPDAKGIIRSYLEDNLTEDDGALWSKHESKNAMIWWEKDAD